MTTYWENPLTGQVETPKPWATADEWAAVRPYHLADELARYTELLADAYTTRDKVNVEATRIREMYAANMASAEQAVHDLEQFVADLRAQAEAECGDRLGELLDSSPSRRAGLGQYTARAYQRHLTAQGVI
jgi:hypothetical protein